MLIVRRFVQRSRFSSLELPLRAAALAFHTVLGIVPILGMGIYYLSRVGVTDAWLTVTRNYVLHQLNLDAGTAFERHFTLLTTGIATNSFGYIGGIFLVFTAWSLLTRFAQSLDTILGKSEFEEDQLKWIWLYFRRTTVLLLLPIALVASLFVAHWVQEGSWMRSFFRIHTVGPMLAMPLAWSSLTISFFLVYYLVPSNKVPLLQALRAALLVAPSSELMRILFSWLNKYVLLKQKIYGVFSVFPIFLFWIYLFWLLVLIGALTMDRRKTRIVSASGLKNMLTSR